MAIIKKILNAKIPLVIAITLLIALVASFVTWTFLFREKVNYSLFVGDAPLAKTAFEFGPSPFFGEFDFFTRVKNTFIKNQADFIEANLSEMKIRVYLDGIVEYEAPIRTKGKEGSWWETPAGIYKIESKHRRIFSSFGQVYMPWNMVFHGNFIIHGWPYYPSGAPVSSAFSGGCIRLSDESAKKIYNLSHVGMPVIVFEEDFSADNFVYQSDPPNLSAKSFLVADMRNNYIFFEKEMNKPRSIASITKLLTALVPVGHLNIEANITVSRNDLIRTSNPRLRAGDRMSVYNLLFPLLMESSNEAAEALASRLGRDRFIALMNSKAESIGMENTEFVDPSGIGAGNKSTPADLFSLARYLHNNRSFILKMSAGDLKDSIYGRSIFQNLQNYNLFHNDPNFLGGKTGQTLAANETFIGIWNLKLSGEERPVAIILLGSDSVDSDAQKVLSWLKSNYFK